MNINFYLKETNSENKQASHKGFKDFLTFLGYGLGLIILAMALLCYTQDMSPFSLIVPTMIFSIAPLCLLWYIVKTLKDIILRQKDTMSFWPITIMQTVFLMSFYLIFVDLNLDFLLLFLIVLEIILCLAEFFIYIIRPINRLAEFVTSRRDRFKVYLCANKHIFLYLICVLFFYLTTTLLIDNICSDVFCKHIDDYGDVYYDYGPGGSGNAMFLYLLALLPIVILLGTFAMNIFRRDIDAKINEVKSFS